MYVQEWVKGIAGRDDGSAGPQLTWREACHMLTSGRGILSNWWRNKPGTCISPEEVQAVLTERNLHRHVHDYENFGRETPYISLAAGCVERQEALARNQTHSAITTALDFATDAGSRPGALFFGWVTASLNQAIPISSVAETIRDLNVYHRWSPYQLEGEITAKVHIPANQISRVEWWGCSEGRVALVETFPNPGYVPPTPVLNRRELF